MSKDSHWMAEVRSIEQLRDELRVKAALLRADLRDDLAVLEKQWANVERELEPVREAVGTTVREVGASTIALLETLRAGYERVRAAARSHV
jgi:hypothetical protein